MNLYQKYILAKISFIVGVAAVIVVAISVIHSYRPSYDVIDVLTILAVGMILGAVYSESQNRVGDYFIRKQTQETQRAINT